MFFDEKKQKTCQFNETSLNMHLGEKKEDMPTQRDKLSSVIKKDDNSLQLIKILQVSCESIRFHHGTLGNVKVLVHIIVQVVRQAVGIQVPEMRQYFQIDRKSPNFSKIFR
ncbi:hypothetical protein TNCV_4361741 [Trichonephila clavipes]|nr:hypothetical protein TNCV_4361741 [Trichonephila clavipes]